MKVVLEPATGAVMIAKTEDGKDIRIKYVAVQPFFTTVSGPAIAMLGKSLDSNGKSVDTFALQVSGTNGKTTKVARPGTKGVVPLIDQKAAKAAAGTKAKGAGVSADG